MKESKKSEFYNLDKTCRLLGISPATGRNWLRLGKLVAAKTPSENDGPMFSRRAIDELLENMQKGRVAVLRSRRNKSALKGRELYVSYVAPDSPNRKNVTDFCAAFKGSGRLVTAVLVEASLRIIVSSGRLKVAQKFLSSPQSLLDAVYKGELKLGRWKFLLDDLVGRNQIENLCSDLQGVPRLELEYVPFEDTLGLLYLSLMEFSERRRGGRYYTPQKLTDEAVETLDISSRTCFLDPCCGSGNFLLRLLRRGVKPQTLYGCDIDKISLLLARINLALNTGMVDEDFLKDHLRQEDTLISVNLPPAQVILGNPPWNICDNLLLERKYAQELEGARKGHPCFADLFVERALDLLPEGGLMRFVLPESLLNVKSHQQIRDIMAKKANVASVAYLGEAFHAVQCPSVVLTLKKSEEGFKPHKISVSLEDSGHCYEVEKDDPLDFNFRISSETQSLLDRIEAVPNQILLKGNATFGLGIVTGDNKNLLLSQRVAGADPVLRGTDLEPYRIKESEKFLIFDREKLQQAAREELYRTKPKIVYRFIANYPIAALDREGRLSLNSCNFIIPTSAELLPEYLVAVLNSSVVRFYFKKSFHTLKVLRSQLEKLPIAVASLKVQQEIASLVVKVENCDEEQRAPLIRQIDKLVADCYGLNPEDFSESH